MQRALKWTRHMSSSAMILGRTGHVSPHTPASGQLLFCRSPVLFPYPAFSVENCSCLLSRMSFLLVALQDNGGLLLLQQVRLQWFTPQENILIMDATISRRGLPSGVNNACNTVLCCIRMYIVKWLARRSLLSTV